MNNQTIVLASNNQGKTREIKAALELLGLKIIPQADLQITEVEETGLTFVENALLKARNAAKHSGLPAIADDSGIVVEALGSAPGIYSARYAGIKADSQTNIEKLLDELKGVPAGSRNAQFFCTLVYLKTADDPCPLICQALWKGSILSIPQGQNGFGYDPIFYVPSHNCSAAELSLAEKNHISHRAQALRQLVLGLVGK